MTSTLGQMLHSEVVQPDGMTSGIVKKGQTIRVTDLDGQQVGDFCIWSAHDPKNEYLDDVYSNLVNKTWRLTAGHKLITNMCNTIATITEDKCGMHYSGGDFCSQPIKEYVLRTGAGRGCRERLETEAAKHGLEKSHVNPLCNFNLFMNVYYEPDGTWEIRLPTSKPGDYIDLRAEMDFLWAVSVCDDGYTSALPLSPLKFELYDAPE